MTYVVCIRTSNGPAVYASGPTAASVASRASEAARSGYVVSFHTVKES